MQVHTLIRVDNHPIGNDPDEIRAFMNIRDEMLRLPRTLEYYRKLGVARFFVTDNGSIDGSKEFLLTQPDCHTFVTSNSYSDALCGLAWQQSLLNEYGLNRWCLTVDVDEWFVYPGSERKRLSDLAAYLDRSGAQGIFVFMLDMYGRGSITASPAQDRRSLLDVCPYFDQKYTWRRRIHIPGIEQPRFPGFTVDGGPRLRMFFPRSYQYLKLLRIMWRVSDMIKFPLPTTFRPPPRLTKIPFVRWLPGTCYQSPHETLPIKLSNVTGVLLHFKFLEDFYARVETELNRHSVDGTIWGTELARYMARLKADPSFSFFCDKSVAYEGSDQLVQLHILREDHGWRQIRTAVPT
jgi:Glycosyl transferase family 2